MSESGLTRIILIGAVTILLTAIMACGTIIKVTEMELSAPALWLVEDTVC